MNGPERALPRLRGLRSSALAGLVMVVVEYGFGMWVNLYARIPRADHSAGLARGAATAIVNGGLAKVVANGPAGLSIHVVLGILLFVSGITVVVRAALLRRALPISLAAAGLAAILVAGGSGARFVGQGSTNASLVMALATGLAIVSYAAILFVSPSPRRLADREDHRAEATAAGAALSGAGEATPAGRHG